MVERFYPGQMKPDLRGMVMAGNTAPEFGLQPVQEDTVDKIVRSLRNSKATGLDYIDTQILKLMRIEIVPALTHIIITSIQTAVYPTVHI